MQYKVHVMCLEFFANIFRFLNKKHTFFSFEFRIFLSYLIWSILLCHYNDNGTYTRCIYVCAFTKCLSIVWTHNQDFPFFTESCLNHCFVRFTSMFLFNVRLRKKHKIRCSVVLVGPSNWPSSLCYSTLWQMQHSLLYN